MVDYTDTSVLEAELRELGGFANDDSLRIGTLVDAMTAFERLCQDLRGEIPPGHELGALVRILRDDLQRVALRQQIDSSRRWAEAQSDFAFKNRRAVG